MSQVSATHQRQSVTVAPSTPRVQTCNHRHDNTQKRGPTYEHAAIAAEIVANSAGTCSRRRLRRFAAPSSPTTSAACTPLLLTDIADDAGPPCCALPPLACASLALASDSVLENAPSPCPSPPPSPARIPPALAAAGRSGAVGRMAGMDPTFSRAPATRGQEGMEQHSGRPRLLLSSPSRSVDRSSDLSRDRCREKLLAAPGVRAAACVQL